MDGDFQLQFVNENDTYTTIQNNDGEEESLTLIANNVESHVEPSCIQEQNSTLLLCVSSDELGVVKEEQMEIENFSTITTTNNDEIEDEEEQPSESEGLNNLSVLLPVENESFSISPSLVSQPQEVDGSTITTNTNEINVAHGDGTEMEEVEENNENGSTNVSQNSFTCNKCSKTFTKKHHLSRHIITHFKRKPFTCSVADCLKGFTRKENLAKHIKLHENEENNDQRETDNHHEGSFTIMQLEEEEEGILEKNVNLPKRRPGRPRKHFNLVEQMKDSPLARKKVLRVKNGFRQKCLREGDKINITCHSCRTKFYSMKKFQTHLKNKNNSRHGTTTTYNKVLQNRKYIKFKKVDSSISSSQLFKNKENSSSQNIQFNTSADDLNKITNVNQDPLQNLNSNNNNDNSFPVQSDSGENGKYCEKCGKTFRTERNRLNHYRLFHSEPKDNIEHGDDDNGDSDLDMLDGMRSDYDDKEDFFLQPSRNQNSNVDYTVPSDAFLQSLNEQGTGSLPFMCMICQKKFARKFHLKRHLVKKLFHCKFKGCEETFEYKCASKIHNNTFHEKDKTFSSTTSSNANDTLNTPENHHQQASSSSTTTTTNEGEISNTNSASGSQRPYKKREPRNKIDGDSKLKSKSFLCSTCGFSCCSPTVFRNHISRQDCDISVPGRIWKCNHEGCTNNEFESKSALRKHAKVHAIPKERPHKCTMPDCEKTFLKLSALKYHLERHSGIKPYKCTEGDCSLAYATVSNLRHHVRAVHLLEKRFLCEDCGKTFGTQTKLRIHTRSHTGERPYHCKIDSCNFGFTTPGALSRHLKCHAKEKGYKCEECGKGFNLRENLKRHNLIHSGEKPYKCKLCPMAFPDNRPLKRHMIIFHIQQEINEQQEEESFSD